MTNSSELEARRAGRRYPERPVLAVLAVVMRGERALIVQRANAPNKGRWGFPGGVLELGETFADGAMRELFEETGVTAEAVDTLSVFDAIDRDNEGRVRHHYVLIAVRGLWRTGEGIAGDDAGAVQWANRAEIIEQGLWIAPLLLPLMDLALERS
jgi:8-oxo-dGTP diphosphatase